MSTSIRINKYLAEQGYSTRRGADTLITERKVTINGRIAKLGDQVAEGDMVEVSGHETKEFVYLAYYKPRGIVTHGAQDEEKEIEDLLKKTHPELDVFPVGRLDKNSHGLIILTNDGRIVEPLLSPMREHEKEYKVSVNERLRADFAENMASGVDIGDYITKPCEVERLTRNTFRIVLTEGKNHQIKRMTSALGYTVRDLKRTRIMNIRLRRMRPGTFRYIKGEELHELLMSLALHT